MRGLFYSLNNFCSHLNFPCQGDISVPKPNSHISDTVLFPLPAASDLASAPPPGNPSGSLRFPQVLSRIPRRPPPPTTSCPGLDPGVSFLPDSHPSRQPVLLSWLQPRLRPPGNTHGSVSTPRARLSAGLRVPLPLHVSTQGCSQRPHTQHGHDAPH